MILHDGMGVGAEESKKPRIAPRVLARMDLEGDAIHGEEGIMGLVSMLLSSVYFFVTVEFNMWVRGFEGRSVLRLSIGKLRRKKVTKALGVGNNAWRQRVKC